MGYMGFGMRKEVYTRKPKKAFEKIKRVYRKELDFPKSKKSRKKKSEKQNREEVHAYQPFYKLRIYKALKALFIIEFSAVLIWYMYLAEKYHQYRRDQFESSTFRPYFKQELQNTNKVLDFLADRTDKFTCVSYSEQYKTYYLELRSEVYGASRQSREYTWFQGDSNDEVKSQNKDRFENGILTVERNGLSRVLPEKRHYTLMDITIEQLPSAIHNYLDTSPESLHAFLTALRLTRSKFIVRPDSVYTLFQHEVFGQYSIIHSAKKFESVSTTNGSHEFRTVAGSLAENIYWVRTDKVVRKN